MDELGRVAAALGGTLVLRPYVVAFLAVFIVIAGRDQGIPRTLILLVWGALVAFGAELASIRTGIPFGLYHYTACPSSTRSRFRFSATRRGAWRAGVAGGSTVRVRCSSPGCS